MYDFIKLFFDLPIPFNMIVLIVLITSFAGMVTSVAKQVRKYTCHRLELDFKRELLDRGLPTDEVERVIRAKSENSNTA